MISSTLPLAILPMLLDVLVVYIKKNIYIINSGILKKDTTYNYNNMKKITPIIYHEWKVQHED